MFPFRIEDYAMRSHSRLPGRRGMMLLDSLFGGAVVLILVALLLPAVQQAREAARKSQCQDHLHNVSIALLDYEVVYLTYPPGWVNQEENRSNFGWGRAILPFIEQKPIYDQLRFDRNTNARTSDSLAVALADDHRHELMRTPIDFFRCPSDPTAAINNGHVPIDIKDRPRPVATDNYVGSNGNGDWSRGRQLRGIFGMNSSTRIGRSWTERRTLFWSGNGAASFPAGAGNGTPSATPRSHTVSAAMGNRSQSNSRCLSVSRESTRRLSRKTNRPTALPASPACTPVEHRSAWVMPE